jgi:uncharacterized membrane protein HdeD (DUF308 family)
MELTLARRWWAVVVRGVAAIVFGVLTLLVPGVTLAALVLLFGAYAIVEGIFNVIASLSGGPAGERWWVLLFEGIVSIAAGVVTFLWPGLTALVLLWVIAGWAIVTGVLEIAAAIRLRREIEGEWTMALSGALSILLGIGIFVLPAVGALAVAATIGVYAIVFGVLLLGLGFRLRRLARHASRPLARAA